MVMPYSANTASLVASETLRTLEEYPETHTWAAVTPAETAPGVTARLGW